MKSDRRVQYTRNAIREAFLSLLESRPMEEISVKEICTIADINRATFYRNYADLYALYDSIEEEILQEAFPDHDESFGILDFLRLIPENRAFFREVYRRQTISKSSLRIIGRYRDTISREYSPDCECRQLDLYLRYAIHGAGGIIRDWIENDCREDAAQLAAHIETITDRLLRSCIE